MEKPSTAKKKTFKPLILFDANRSSSKKTCDNTTELQNEQVLIEEHRLKIKSMLDYNAHIWEKEGRLYETTLSSQSNSLDRLEQSSLPTTIGSSDHNIINPISSRDRPNESPTFFVDSQASHNYVSISHDSRRRKDSILSQSSTFPEASFAGGINTLEPQTQTSIPLPLHNQRVSVRATNNPSTTSNFISSATSPILSEGHCRRNSIPLNIKMSEEEIEEETEYFDTEEEESIPNATTSSFTFGTTFINEPQFHHTYRPHIFRKHRRGNLPKQVTEYLKEWLLLHKKHPYPTEREKQKLADETGLMINQISNWFINARRRILQPLIESENREQQQSEASDQASSSSSILPPTGINVVGGSSNDSGDVNQTHRMKNPSVESSSRDQYHPHHHHNYTNNSRASTGDLLLQQPSEDDSLDIREAAEGQEYRAPPPWMLLPANLPSMNILEKDLDAFKSDEKE